MSIGVDRTVRQAIAATTVERARSLVIEQALAIVMIVTIGALLLPLAGQSEPSSARADESPWSGGIRTQEAPSGRYNRDGLERTRAEPQGLREMPTRTGR